MIKCPVCDTKTDEVLTDKLRRGLGKVYYCKDCDLGFLQNMIIDTKDYYDNEYRKEYSHKAEENETNAEEIFDIYVNYQKERIDALNKYKNNDDSFLEIGSSAGQFLSHIKDKFKSINAIELDSNCCKFVEEKFKIATDSNYLEESKFNIKDNFSVVSAFQVLEHTPDPISFLKTIHHVLEDDGIALIEVPNLYDPLISVWDVPAYNTFYYHSAHSFYFSEKSLSIIAKKAEFEVLDFVYTQDYNILNHINWILNDSPQNDCVGGLNKPSLQGKDPEITNWLNNELNLLNEKYFEKLAESKKTSNILMVVKK
ncbi:class I SAM-dependent methyltransferase [Sulfurimonas sp.]|uniref:class I SAM-dependent methyltransferase n=1 Tax=Sulfurimonas sp. TaxID=2022749 RepID=UPI0025F18723|nr:class I SAM-dependent methyltransferase [Sulfurimonas sp.]